MMFLTSVACFLLFTAQICSSFSLGNEENAASAKQACEQVNPFIATSGLGWGYGAISPAAQYPFGAFRVGPDTTYFADDLTWRHYSGYNYQDTTIRAFSHTRLVGGGVNDLGSVGIMPITRGGKEEIIPEYLTFPSSNERLWSSVFNKSTEFASPGFYSVHLDTPKVEAELMAIGTLAGIHRYTWDDTADAAAGLTIPGLVIDMCHESKTHRGADDSHCREASITVDANNKNVFSGYVHTIRGYLSGELMVYIYAEIVPTTGIKTSKPSWTFCSKQNPESFERESNSSHKVACSKEISTLTASQILFSVVSFDKLSPATSKKPFSVDIQIGISFISVELAKQNLQDALQETTNYEKLAQRTKQVWCDTLNYLSFTTLPDDNDPDTAIILHSASYRTFMSPTDYTESGGLYLGMDQQVHNVTEERLAQYGVHSENTLTTSKQFRRFSDLSFWDTFRSLHPYFLLIDEDLSMGFARSILEVTFQQNGFPRWILASHESGCMNGLHGMAFFIELVLAGFGDELGVTQVKSLQQLFLAQLTTAWPVNGRVDLDHYLANGYVSSEAEGKSTSISLANYYDDYLLGILSNYVGDAAAAEAAFTRSENYKIIWSPERLFFCPKLSTGEMQCPENPADYSVFNKLYTEGNALQYAWFVPHSPEGLLALYDTPQAFDQNLQEFMNNHEIFFEKYGNPVPNPYYWPGNEHDLLAPWLFNVGPNCTNAQYWTRRLTYLHFWNTPRGIPGNDDCGSLSTWLLFASFGLYPQAGTTRFFIGSPRVATANIRLKHWNSDTPTMLEIVTYNNSMENTFIEKLLVNGQEWKQPWLERKDLTNPTGNVRLEFYMHANPISGLCATAK